MPGALSLLQSYGASDDDSDSEPELTTSKEPEVEENSAKAQVSISAESAKATSSTEKTITKIEPASKNDDEKGEEKKSSGKKRVIKWDALPVSKPLKFQKLLSSSKGNKGAAEDDDDNWRPKTSDDLLDKYENSLLEDPECTPNVAKLFSLLPDAKSEIFSVAQTKNLALRDEVRNEYLTVRQSASESTGEGTDTQRGPKTFTPDEDGFVTVNRSDLTNPDWQRGYITEEQKKEDQIKTRLGAPSKGQKSKHQIGSLAFAAIQAQNDAMYKPSSSLLTKAQTQAKYGW
mmetsp:Transcript_4402/g.4923  ORF Transcript_4402/g.4923 Transcript_4402/m.4923 type:complete len:288 (-) Transcript_4402:152-1015(-)